MAKTTFKDINSYINSFDEPIKSKLEEMLQIFRKAAPEAEETISYAIPTFKVNGKYVGYFAGFKDHASFYPIPHASEQLKKEMESYIAGKGTLHFSLNKPLPDKLIIKLVRYWVGKRSDKQSKINFLIKGDY